MQTIEERRALQTEKRYVFIRYIQRNLQLIYKNISPTKFAMLGDDTSSFQGPGRKTAKGKLLPLLNVFIKLSDKI